MVGWRFFAGVFRLPLYPVAWLIFKILNRMHLIDLAANRRYLLEQTQHLIGGFGKVFQAPPGTFLLKSTSAEPNGHKLTIYDITDIMHSYLGLAALALMKESGLRSIDSTLCISLKAREHLESLPWWVGGDSHNGKAVFA